MTRSRAGVVAAGAALILLVSACGSSSSASPAATGAGAAATTTAPSATAPSGSSDSSSPGRGGGGGRDGGRMSEAITAFTTCLTDQGITVPDVSIGGRRNGSGETPPSGGSFPQRGDGQTPSGSFPAGGRNGGAGFDPTTMIVERLGLDTSDPAVAAAIQACSSTLTAAMPAGGAPAESPTTTTA